MSETPIRKWKINVPALAVIFDDQERVLLGKRHYPGDVYHDKWGFPGGGIDFDEQPKDTAVRETKEEVGVTITLLTETPIVGTFSLKENNMQIIYLAYPAVYKEGIVDTSKDPGTSAAKWFTYQEINDVDCLPHTKGIVDRAKKFLNNN